MGSNLIVFLFFNYRKRLEEKLTLIDIADLSVPEDRKKKKKITEIKIEAVKQKVL